VEGERGGRNLKQKVRQEERKLLLKKTPVPYLEVAPRSKERPFFLHPCSHGEEKTFYWAKLRPNIIDNCYLELLVGERTTNSSERRNRLMNELKGRKGKEGPRGRLLSFLELAKKRPAHPGKRKHQHAP